MFLVEGRLIGVLAALATAGILAFCSTRDEGPSNDAGANGPLAPTVFQAETGDAVQPRTAQHSLLASREVAGSARTRRY